MKKIVLIVTFLIYSIFSSAQEVSVESFADGTGTAAQFDFPAGAATDVNDNLYMTVSSNGNRPLLR
ncbi:MAG: hypothetical protein ACI7YS_16760 [Flavobacterium sp.]